MSEEKVVYKNVINEGARRVEIEVKEDYIMIRYWVFPIYPYGNNVRDTIKVYKCEAGEWLLEGWTTRENWDGTGSEPWGAPIVLEEHEVKTIKELAKKIKKVEDINELKEYIEELITKRDNVIAETLKELIDSVIELLNSGYMADKLKDENIMRELKEYLVAEAYRFLLDS